MTTTPDNTATTWRDLADQLTPKQRESFEYLEQTSHGQVPAHLVLGWARQAVEGNLVDMAYCDVHPPAGVISVGAWEQHREHGWSRVAVWHSYEGAVADPRLAGTHISVDITGWQHCDGGFTRSVALWGVQEGEELTGERARAVAALLLEAADELDRWAGA